MEHLINEIDKKINILEKLKVNTNNIDKQISIYNSILNDYNNLKILSMTELKSTYNTYRNKIKKEEFSSIITSRMLINRTDLNKSQISNINKYCNIMIDVLNDKKEELNKINYDISKAQREYIELKERLDNKSKKILSIINIKLLREILKDFDIDEAINIYDYIIKQQSLRYEM